MKIQQLSLFLENRAGQLRVPCQVLADAGINIITLSLADTQQFGILRLIVDDWQRAKEILEQAGCVVRVTDVIAIEVNDRPGGLNQILAVLDKEGISVEYMYAFTFGRGDKAILIFRFEDLDKAIAILKANGMNVLEKVELDERIKK